jgi:peptidyl-prolyl cis-trans isomerase C
MYRWLSILFLGLVSIGFSQTATDDPIVLKAGDSEMGLSEFNERFAFYTNQLAQEQGLPMSPEIAPMFNSLRPEYLEQLATEYLILNLGLARELSYSPEFVEQRLAEIKANFPDEETYLQQIQQAGLSDTTFRKLIGEADLSTRSIDLLRADITVKPYQLRLYYDAHKSEFATAAEACAKHILVPTLEEAQAIQAELDSGKSFEELAATKSQDPDSGANGGDLGCFPQGAMVPEFEAAAFSEPLNKVTAPIQSQFGFHLILPYERHQGSVSALEEVQDQVQEGAQNDILRKLLKDYRTSAAIETFPDLVTIVEATPAPSPDDGGSE